MEDNNLESRLSFHRGNMKKEVRLITSALPYINNVPHLGHIVGSHLPADIFARFCRTKGYETLFVGGTDENGTTSEIAAESVGVDIETFAKTLRAEHKKIYDWFGISYDHFSTTSSPVHHKTTQDFFKVVNDNGFISPGKMKVFYSPKEDRFLADRYIVGTCPKCGYPDANGDQCEKCTSVLEPMQLVNPRSANTDSPVEVREAKHLFLRLDKLSPQIESWIKKQDNWRSQVTGIALGWIKEGLRERCITRDLKHGIPVPEKGYEDKVFYVWFDAPIGYVSATKEARPNDWERFWKNDDSRVYNFLGKDNIPFHTIFWPGMLLAHKDMNLPYNVVGLQYLNYEGGKFSKSKKRGVFCEKLAETGIDPDLMRGYLTSVIPETDDTEFTWEEFARRINSDIIGNYSNLMNRTVSFISTRLDGYVERPKESKLTEEDKALAASIETRAKKIEEHLESAQLRSAYAEFLALSSDGNRYFEQTKPWIVIKTDKERTAGILYNCAGLCKSLSVLSSPFMPGASQKVWNQLGLNGKADTSGNWDSSYDLRSESSYKTGEPKVLFGKITPTYLAKFKEQVSDTLDLAELFK